MHKTEIRELLSIGTKNIPGQFVNVSIDNEGNFHLYEGLLHWDKELEFWQPVEIDKDKELLPKMDDTHYIYPPNEDNFDNLFFTLKDWVWIKDDDMLESIVVASILDNF